MALLTSALLAKAAMPWAGRLALSGFTKVVRRPRVARAAAKRAAEAGIPVTAKSLRVWLARKDTGAQLRDCSEASLDQAAGRLAFVMPGGSAEERRRNALQVLWMVMEESVRAADPSQAALLVGSWGLQTTQEEGRKTRDQLRELQQDVRGRDVLEQAVRTLSPWAAEEALLLATSWPGVAKCMDILSASGRQRGDVLRQWADTHPAWLEDAPAGVYAWLGHLAADYDASGASRHFFEVCLREGGHPRDYYTMLAALQEEDGTDEGARRYLDTHGDGGSSPLLAALRGLLDGAWEQGLVDLRQWEPHHARAAAIKTQLEAKALLHLQRPGEALAVLRAADETSSGTGVALAAALLEYARHSRTTNRLGAGQEALAVALRARNSRRSWSGDSTEAAVLAVQAAVVSEDLALAWKLARPTPEGEAEPHEAEDPRMGAQTALVAAMTGRWREAGELVQCMPQGFARAHAAAVLAESRKGHGTNAADVRRLWQEAWEVAISEGEQFTAAAGLASSGADLPDLSHLTPLFGERIQELELLARALHAEGSDPLSLLRAHVTKSPVIVVALAERYHRAGDITLAAETLRDGSVEWNDARLMAMAASLFLETKDHPQARECAQEALRMAGPGWAGQGRMYALLVDAESADGRIDRATDAALRLLELDPLDIDARWALVKCYALRSLLDQAWQALTTDGQGRPLEPRSSDEMALWVMLGARFTTDPHFTGRALALTQRWRDNSDLVGRVLANLHWRAVQPASSLSEQDVEQLRTATAAYLERFPDSTVFRAVEIGPENDPLKNVAEELRRSHENAKELHRRTAAGEMPAGMIVLSSGRSYAEILLRPSAERPHAYAADAVANPAEAEAVQAARSGRVVVDTSAAITLALLEPGVAERLMGHPRALVTTDQLFTDALHAQESLALRTDMELTWDEGDARPAVRTTSVERLARMRTTSARLVEVVRAMPRVPRPELRSLRQLPLHRSSTQWLTALDHAKEYGLVLWCDDRVLRAVAWSEGVATFGTLALLDARVKAGLTTPEEALLTKAELLRNHYVDIPFSADLYHAAALADGWQAKAVAVALSRPSAWADAKATSAFTLDAASRVVSTLPHEATGWISAAYGGLHRATPPAHRQRNLRAFSLQVLMQSWISSSTLPFAWAGLRAGVEAAGDSDAPLEAALTLYHRALAEELTPLVAAGTLTAMFVHTDEADRAMAARVVLTSAEY
ncbi:tetratricopeptide repeat protein [Streptomyces sp. NPDC017966]|uniref:tetratricopeptide repeat protein n=1 Tax=Streptomyces sp. NPDC017966 TaxID=3365023 RepID=UPI00378B3374